jgi:hypothetical protein
MMEKVMSQNVPVFRALSVFLALVVALLVTEAQAAEPGPLPAQLALWKPIQVVDSERSVLGFRYSLLWGINQDVSGLDISTGLSKTSGDFIGIQAGGLNFVDGDVTGLQIGLFGLDTGHMRGVQLGLLAGSFAGEVTGIQIAAGNSATRARGLQLGIFLNASEEMKGFQLAGWLNGSGDVMGPQLSGMGNIADGLVGLQASSLCNVANDRGTGFQISGLLNYADDMKGFQLGLINFNKKGFQLGLINFNKKGFQLGLINFNEKGFLRIFPFFNFGL